MELHPALQYNASKQTLRTQNFQVQPMGSKTQSANGVYRFRLPEKSLVNLSSLNWVFDATVSGLNSDATNFSNVKLPAAYKFIKALRFYVNGQLASGGLSQHYDMIHDALVRCQGGEDYINSHANENLVELIAKQGDIYKADGTTAFALSDANPTVTSISNHYVLSNFLGLPIGNGTSETVIDTTLFGTVELEIILNDTSCMMQYKEGSGSIDNITYSIDNATVNVDCITQVSPLYVELISALVSQPNEEIRFPFMNFSSVVVTGASTMRVQASAGCVDALVYMPLPSNYSDAHVNTDPDNKLNPPRYTHNSGVNVASASTSSLSVQVGSVNYLSVPITNALNVADITASSLFGGSLFTQNLLNVGITSSTVGYSKKYFLTDNFIWHQSFSLEPGYQSKKLSGIDTANTNVDFIVQASNAYPSGGSVCLALIQTSVLTYSNGRVFVQP